MPTLLPRLMRPVLKTGQILPCLPSGVALAGLLRRLDLQLVPGSRHRWTRGVQKACGDYLSRAFSVADRLAILGCHYRRCLDSGRYLGGPRTLFSRPGEGGVAELALDRASLTRDEGEQVLEYRWNGTVLYRLTFSIVPGHLVPGAPGDTLFIGGSQGGRGTSALFREAARSHGDLCPTVVAFLGLQALGRHLGLGALAATRVDHSVASCLARTQDHSLYDQHWEILGGQDQGWCYLLPLEPEHKDLSLVSASHRRRARKRQEFRWELYQAILESCGRAG